MGIVRVSPELGLLFDPLKGVVSQQREDAVQYSLDPLYTKIARLDRIADDLVNQLVPDNDLMESYANRAKCSYIGGLYTNIWMGFIIGLTISFVILVSSLFATPEGVLIVRNALNVTTGGV